MAQKVLVTMVDDLDGTTGSEVTTVAFGLDGVEYEIDLNEDNSDALRNVLADYIERARRTGGRRRRTGNSNKTGGVASPGPVKAPSRPRDELTTIRHWARTNGYPDIADRGRIPQAVLVAYDEAHAPGPRKGRRNN